ncbi:MAG: signal peptidase I [Candidatus Velamenicoccus archaeovorus]
MPTADEDPSEARTPDPAPTPAPSPSQDPVPTSVPPTTRTEPAPTVTAGAGGGSADAPERPAPREEKERGGSFLREVPVLVLIALVVAILIKTFLVQAFYIPSASMEPTLMPGDRVLVNKLAYRLGDIHRGDVVVFANPQALPTDRNWFEGLVHWLGEGLGVAQPEDEDLIKRVIGVPGDTVEIRDHTVSVNGTPLSEPYLTPAAEAAMQDFGPVTVRPGHLFVMGDNRGNSADSRFSLGQVPEDDVIGRAFVIVWPPSDLGGLG